MDTTTDQTLERLICALAVAGIADQTMLAALTASQPTSMQMGALLRHPAVTEQEGWLSLDEPVATSQRKALEQHDFLHFLQLSETAIELLGEALHPTNEPKNQSLQRYFQQLFIRLADLLLNQKPERLLALVERVQQLPLSPSTYDDSQLFAGIALRNLERYAEAETIFATLLATPTLALSTRGRTLNAAAITAFLQGRLQQALDEYAASLAIWRQLGDAVQEGMVCLNMGVVAYECHDYGMAEQQLQYAEQLLTTHQHYTWLAAAQHELALVYRDQGRWQEALIYFERCAVRRRQEGAEQHLALVLDSIGEVYLLQGHFAKALPLLQEAEQKMTSRINRIDLLLHLGLLYQIQDDFATAAAYYTQALDLVQQMEQSYLLPVVYYRLGDLHARLGVSETALTYWLRAIRWIEENRTPLREEGLKINLLGRWQQLYAAVICLLVDQQRYGEALTYVERARSRAFLDLLHNNGDLPLTADNEVIVSPLIQGQLPPDSALIEFFACGLPGTSAAMIANLPATAARVRDHLLPPERLLAFVVTPTRIAVVELTTTLRQIEAQHFTRADGRLRGVTPLPDQPLRHMHRWQKLGRQLLAPLAPYVTGKRHLYFVPHSTLHYLPLHALCDLDQLTGQQATTASYAPSASILLKTLERSQPRIQAAPFLAIGVDADGLSHAEAEATWIAQRLGGHVLLGRAATPAAVLAQLGDYPVIHFSCHGHFRQREPMASALQLTDGELTAAHLLQAVRLNAMLITLSACDTGLNQLHPGDEFMGLTRAFLGCGARSLLVSLWPVHEIPTRLLMEQFYESWRHGATKAVALHAAQRSLATMDRDRLMQYLIAYGIAENTCIALIQTFERMLPGGYPFAHPYYWAAFLLIGDPG